jgi:Ca-activated chloride channel family protein
VAQSPTLAALIGSADWARRRRKAALLTLATACLLLALVGPQWGFHWEDVKRRGVDLIIALDVSKSMLAQDVKPNRLERAKLAIQELIPLLKGDRIGLVVFAGTGFLQCPLTVDYGAFGLILADVSTDAIPRGGTSISQAIRTGLSGFEASQAESRALVLITDGEDHEGRAQAAADEAAKAGVKIFAVGIGTPEGELVPVIDEQGSRTFLKDGEGRTVKSRLDESVLQRIALQTGGSYARATATAFGLDLLYRERIATMKAQEQEAGRQKRHELRYQWPLALALLLLCAEMMLSDRRRGQA